MNVPNTRIAMARFFMVRINPTFGDFFVNNLQQRTRPQHVVVFPGRTLAFPPSNVCHFASQRKSIQPLQRTRQLWPLNTQPETAVNTERYCITRLNCSACQCNPCQSQIPMRRFHWLGNANNWLLVWRDPDLARKLKIDLKKYKK